MTDAISAEEYNALVAEEQNKPSKYKNKWTTVDGIKFQSKAEAARYVELKQMEREGLIAELDRQPAFPLLVDGVKIGTYKADFEYWDCEKHERVWEDVKGVKTPLYKRSKKHVEAQYGIKITEV